MRTVLVTAVLTLAIDQGVKDLLRRRLGTRSVRLGAGATLRLVSARMWLARANRESRVARMWLVWVLAAGALVTLAGWIPSSSVPVGLLLGGSLSHAWETTARGSVSDYICSKWWPAFNLADVAITAGTVGIVLTGTLALRAALG